MKKIIVLVGLIAVALTGCTTGPQGQIGVDQTVVNKQLSYLHRLHPTPVLRDSGSLVLQDAYYTAIADPNKIWYLATLALDGSVVSTYTVRGPVENVSDQVTNPLQLDCEKGRGSKPDGCGTIGLAEPNGVYSGQSNDHIARLVSGAILRFEGNFQVQDQPFVLPKQVKLSINENAPVTATDTSKTVNAYVSPRK